MEGADSALLPVLLRHAAYGPSTSGVEQLFSKFKRTFGDQRLGGHEMTELDLMKLIFDYDTNEEAEVLKSAQEHWVREFGMARKKPVEERIHAGRKVKRPQENTEVSTLKRRRKEVKKLVHDADSDELKELEVAGMAGWTEGHEKERKFQITKERKRKVQACIEGVLGNNEVDDELAQDVALRRTRDEKNRKIRVAARTKATAKMANVKLDKMAMRGMTVFIDGSVKTVALLRQAEGLLLRVVADRMEVAAQAEQRGSERVGGRVGVCVCVCVFVCVGVCV
jgi:hypothetical protein